MAEAEDPTPEIEVIARLAESGPFGVRIIATLLRRILELQDHADEEELLSMVAQVEALLRGEGQDAH